MGKTDPEEAVTTGRYVASETASLSPFRGVAAAG
jgi:hypothetical protein